MKATELIIGDWVRLRYVRVDTGQVVVRDFQVSQIRESAFHTIEVWSKEHGNMGDIDKIEPIPITPEILEKNGFKYNEHPFVQGYEQFGLVLYHGGDGYRINCGQNVALQLDSVHQLQHALRLCGIEKEITL